MDVTSVTKSQEPVITVKIPINWDMMTKRAKKRLVQILGRDKRVIRAFFGVIEENEPILLRGKTKDRIDENKLHAMTMTAIRAIDSKKRRLVVKHDLKAKFPRISPTELSECRMVAVENYVSYLSLRRRNKKPSRPCEVNKSGRIPRRAFIPYRAKLLNHVTSVASWWLELRDSLDSAPMGSRVHDKLTIPLKISPFHLGQLKRGEKKSVQVFVDGDGKWWVSVAMRLMNVPRNDTSSLPPAVLGIDLGINRAACTTLLTPTKVSETRYFVQKDKVKVIERYDNLVADLQHEFDTLRNNGQRYDHVVKKLKTLRSKRANVSKEYDRVFVRQLLDYISELNEKYNLYVSMGRILGIRNIARKGNYQGRGFRRMIHRWSFSRITLTLQHGLEQLGWKVTGKKSRFRSIPESWTSIMCWKCGRKGIRPKQSLFICHTCGFKTNADRNGSLNIAHRLIKLIPSLQDEKLGLGRWLSPERAPAPKAARKTRSSKQKSSLSKRDKALDHRESAVIRSTQTSILDFGDDVKNSDNDLAVVRAVEDLSVAESNASALLQEKETKTKGEIVS